MAATIAKLENANYNILPSFKVGSMAHVPAGFRFTPTQEQLLTVFLKNKAMGLPLPNHALAVETNLYEEDAIPWEILRDDDPHWQEEIDWSGKVHKDKKIIYVISNADGNNGTRSSVRTAGGGTWDASAEVSLVRNGKGEIIGRKMALSFNPKGATMGEWDMDEYVLDGISLEGGGVTNNNEYVICQVKRDDSKFSRPLTNGGGRID